MWDSFQNCYWNSSFILKYVTGKIAGLLHRQLWQINVIKSDYFPDICHLEPIFLRAFHYYHFFYCHSRTLTESKTFYFKAATDIPCNYFSFRNNFSLYSKKVVLKLQNYFLRTNTFFRLNWNNFHFLPFTHGCLIATTKNKKHIKL